MNTVSRFRRMSATLVVGAVTVASLSLSSQLVSASTPTNGALFFQSVTGGRTGEFSALNVDGSDADVPTGVKGSFGAPGFSPDGTKMVWTEANMGKASVLVANTDGTNVVTLFSNLNEMLGGFQFSSDGSRLYFFADAGMSAKIYAVDPTIANQSLTGKDVFTYSGRALDIAISKDGKAAIIGEAACGTSPNVGRGLVVQDISAGTSGFTGAGTVVPDAATCDFNNNTILPLQVEWSLDGTKMYVAQVEGVAFSSNRLNLQINEFNEGGKIGSIFYAHTGTDNVIKEMAMAPDGTKIGFYVEGNNTRTPEGLYVLDLSSKNATAVNGVDVGVKNLVWAPRFTSASPTTSPTVAPTVTAVTTVIPGVTVTDTTVYRRAPSRVASSSAITVLTRAEARTSDIVTKTPRVCLPANDDLVFIKAGRCVAEVVNEKSGRVLRTLRTRVVNDDVSELNIGNEVVTLAPIFFTNGSSTLTSAAKRRINSVKDRVSAAGTVLIVGHSGVVLGDTPENRALATARAKSVVAGLRSVKAKGPFYVTPVGAAAPAVSSIRSADQAKNRRVEIVLIP